MMKKTKKFLCLIVFNTFLVSAVIAQPTSQNNNLTENDKWDLESSYPGVDGTVQATTVSGDYLYVAGSFSNAGGVSTQNIARYNIEEKKWDSLSTGVNGSVSDIVLDGDYIYAAGSFTEAGNKTVNNIARFNLENEIWEPLGEGITGEIADIADLHIIDTNIFVGGKFDFAGEDSANNIARFDLENNTWHSLGDGVNSNVYSLGGSNEELFITGNFSIAGGDSALNIAKYNISTENWDSFEEEFTSTSSVRLWSIYNIGDNVYVGGIFDSVGIINSPNIVRYNKTDKKWYGVGSGTNAIIYDIIEANGDLYIGGYTRNGRQTIGSLLTLNTADSTLDETNINFNDAIFTMSTNDDKLFVGGNFSSRITEFNLLTEKQTALGDGFNGDINEILISENTVYLGGVFTSIDNKILRGIVRYNTDSDSWLSVGGGGTLGRSVNALETYNSEIYLGGAFRRLGKNLISYFGKYSPNDNSFSAVEGGVNGTVKDLLIAGDNLFVAGDFFSAGVGPNRVQTSGIARFDLINKTWHAMGNVSGGVSSLAWDENSQTLFIGGNFSKINEDDEFKKIAAFSFETEEWINLNPEMNRGVDVIHLHNGSLYVGGRFTKIAEQNIAYIAKYNIQTKNWSSLGAGVNNNVRDIISTNDKLYITGSFTSSGETVLNGIAKYNTVDENIYPLGDGLFNGNETAYGSALASSENYLYVGGRFKQAGGKPASMFARYKLDSPVSNEEVTQDVTPQSFNLFQNYPNPFNPTTNISYQLPMSSEVSLTVFDLLGRKVAVLVDGEQKTAGQHQVAFDASNLASGMYIYRLQAGNQVFTKKLTLIK